MSRLYMGELSSIYIMRGLVLNTNPASQKERRAQQSSPLIELISASICVAVFTALRANIPTGGSTRGIQHTHERPPIDNLCCILSSASYTRPHAYWRIRAPLLHEAIRVVFSPPTSEYLGAAFDADCWGRIVSADACLGRCWAVAACKARASQPLT